MKSVLNYFTGLFVGFGLGAIMFFQPSNKKELHRWEGVLVYAELINEYGKTGNEGKISTDTVQVRLDNFENDNPYYQNQ